MNFRELLDAADYNKEEAKYEASFKRYSSDLPPPKKNAKSGVQSDGIRKFLQRQKAEADAKALEAQKLKEQLLTMRAQSTKNNKKAKIMASRTKDNDFSRIRLTEDMIESKKKIEAELQKKHLADKKERMKARIDLEEKEALLPRKRKRKSKAAELEEERAHFEERARQEEELKTKDKNPIRKAPKQLPPVMSFSELLKVAEVKQHEPVIIQKKKQEEEKLLTKKERKLKEEEDLRLKRKEERLKKGESLLSRPNPTKHSSVGEMQNGKACTKSPHVVHVEKETVSSNSQKLKIPKSDSVPSKNLPKPIPSDKGRFQTEKQSKVSSVPKQPTNHDRSKFSASERPLVTNNTRDENKPVIKKSSTLKQVQKKSTISAPPVPVIDTDAIAAAIEKRIREKIEKEIEEKLVAKFQNAAKQTSISSPVNKPGMSNGTHVSINGKKVPHNQQMVKKVSASKPDISSHKRPLEPEKRPFHPNPYLDTPRRRLEPQRPIKPPSKRRIESDDEDDDDDMSDFIDDGASQNDEDYSKYIKEIFGYDRRKYVDVDDDDIKETSFVEQMKEETRSAKLGYLEDLEEERKLREMEKKRKMKKK